MEKLKVAIEDFAKVKKLGSLTLAPDGSKAAFTVTEGDVAENKYRTDIWIADPEKETAVYRLTAGEDGKSPVFMDDDTIVFPGDRKKKYKIEECGPVTVWNRISLSGGEASEYCVLPFISSTPFYIGEDKWLCGGTKKTDMPEISSLGDDEKKKVLMKLKDDRDYEVFDELPFWMNGQGVTNKFRTGLYICDVKKNEQKLLTDTLFQLSGFTVNKGKTKAVFWGMDFSSSMCSMKTDVFTLDLGTLEIKECSCDKEIRVDSAAFSGEDVILTASTGEKYGTSENEALWLLDISGKISLICEPDITMGGCAGSDVAGGGSNQGELDGFFYTHTDKYISRYEKADKDGKVTVLADEIPVMNCAVGEEKIFITGMEKDGLQEVYFKENGKFRKLSSFNDEYLETHEIAHTEHFTFTDSDGVDIDGWILKPADFCEEKKYPAILSVHGGPRTVYGEPFFHEMQYWAGRGYVVFFCNPRGSSGRGDEFADILGEKFGVLDYNDIMEFTDEVLKRVPQIDDKRVAMTGGSYGGFMANWIIGHTDRFAAVASCRSISNYISKCLTTDIGFYHNLSQIEADPWNNPKQMWDHSPLAYADKAVTPTLFIQSDEDYRCWMGDAIQMLQALLMKGVPARMCMFHGENHELSRSGKPKHRIRRIEEITGWFDKYLGVEEQ